MCTSLLLKPYVFNKTRHARPSSCTQAGSFLFLQLRPQLLSAHPKTEPRAMEIMINNTTTPLPELEVNPERNWDAKIYSLNLSLALRPTCAWWPHQTHCGHEHHPSQTDTMRSFHPNTFQTTRLDTLSALLFNNSSHPCPYLTSMPQFLTTTSGTQSTNWK